MLLPSSRSIRPWAKGNQLEKILGISRKTSKAQAHLDKVQVLGIQVSIQLTFDEAATARELATSKINVEQPINVGIAGHFGSCFCPQMK